MLEASAVVVPGGFPPMLPLLKSLLFGPVILALDLGPSP
jgi:hypothetical protein